ncbi:MAG: CHAT domain-containing protein [Coleofasciculaceae cyanobacterium]
MKLAVRGISQSLTALYLLLEPLGLGQTSAQPIISAADGTGTIVSPQGDSFNIGGGSLSGDGTNLFHSFSEFGLNQNQIANFLSQPGIENILGRINGGEASWIDGLIQVTGGNSNLFLMNPAGIVFGSHAQLNVTASFTATTATGIGFGEDRWLSAIGSADYSTLVGKPQTFSFASTQTPGAIVNEGLLAVKPGANISLLGGSVISTGTLEAPAGNITIAAVPGESLVNITFEGHLLSVEVQPSQEVLNPLSLPELLTGNNLGHATGVRVNQDGTVQLMGSDLTVGAGDVVAKNITGQTATLRANGNLTLVESQLSTTGNLNLLALSTVRVRGSESNPFFAKAGGNLYIQGNDNLDFQAFNSVETPFQSGGDLSLVSNGEITLDAHFSSGGSISIQDSLGIPGNFNSLYDPIISANGDVEFGDYTGVALKVETTGSIRAGNITITAPDTPTFIPTTDPHFNELTTSRALILQAGKTELDNPPNLPQGGLVRSDFVTTLNQSSPASITTGNINTSSDLGDAGSVALEATGNISSGNIVTTDISLTGNSGDVLLSTTGGQIQTGLIDTSEPNNGSSGNVTLLATGKITVNDAINTSNRLAGNAGDVSFSAPPQLVNGLPVLLDTRNFGDPSGNSRGLVTNDAGSPSDNLVSPTSRPTGIPNPVRLTTRPSDNGGTQLPDDTVVQQNTGLQPPSTNTASQPPSTNTGSQPPLTDSTTSGLLSGSLIEVTQLLLTTLNQQSSQVEVPIRVPILKESDPVYLLEETFTEEFTTHLEIPSKVKINTIDDVRNRVREIEQASGIKTGVIYVSFTPTSTAISEAECLTGSSKVDNSSDLQASEPTQPQTSCTNLRESELELLMVTAEGEPVRWRISGASRSKVLATVREFHQAVTNPAKTHTTNYLNSAQQLYKWLVAPLQNSLQIYNIESLVFSLDEGLRSLPIAALHDGQRFLVDKYSVSLVPSLSLTNARYKDFRPFKVLAMGASEFDDLASLPGVAVELAIITQKMWTGQSFLNETFTLDNLKAQRSQDKFGIIHLATHAQFRAGAPKNSYIQMWKSKLRINELSSLQLNDPPVELLVLSACRTALGDREAELGFAGSALLAGVDSTLATLWYVSDQGALGLTTEFYSQLSERPIKAEALRQAQLAMIRGDVRIENNQLYNSGKSISLPTELSESGNSNLSHPYYWAAFTLVGDPI